MFVLFSVLALKNACWSDERDREKAVEESKELLQLLENELNEKRFFEGVQIGFVDIVANVIGFWLGVFEEAPGVVFLTRERFPKLCNRANEFMGNSVIKESLPPRVKLTALLRLRFGITTSK